MPGLGDGMWELDGRWMGVGTVGMWELDGSWLGFCDFLSIGSKDGLK